MALPLTEVHFTSLDLFGALYRCRSNLLIKMENKNYQYNRTPLLAMLSCYSLKDFSKCITFDQLDVWLMKKKKIFIQKNEIR